MLACDKVSISYGARTLFSDLSFTIRAKERWSLAGPNGAGKSTLLKIITGRETPDSGRIIKAKQTTVGYLPQEGVTHDSGDTVFQEAEKAFNDVLELKEQLAEVEAQLETEDPQSEKYGDLLEVFGDIQLRMEHHDLNKMKPRIETVLSGLGFKNSDFDRNTAEFSGGWQMRIAMAKLLLQEPSVLLLDEPTNHLDIETVQWLEQWLRQYGGAIILISHDRSMLDNLTNRTLAFENGGVQQYSGNYSFYLKEREIRKEQLQRAHKNQQRFVEKQQQLIDRFRAKATKAKMVQSRIKQLEKLVMIEMEQDQSAIDFRFPQPERSGQTVIKFEDLCKHYGDNKVINDFDFEIERGDKIAIVGVNGAGKSTFSRMLAGTEEPTSGERNVGHKVGIAYFSQTHADELNPDRTVLQTLEGHVTDEAAGNLRTLLGAFLFRGDDVFKSVSVLSGGERGRLALARMLLQPANFLILDEPTNHLDLASQEVLQRALQDYTGAYVIVSHNRSFLDPIVTKVLEFIPNQPPKLYYGNVSDYIEKKQADLLAAQEASPAGGGGSSKSAAKSSGGSRKEQRRLEAKAREAKAAKLKPLKAEFEQIEEEIGQLEIEKAELTKKLVDPEFFKSGEEEVKAGTDRFAEVEKSLESHYSRWDELSEEIERIEAS